MPHIPLGLPPEMTVIERGWLSANAIVFAGSAATAVVDTGYCAHAAQTVALVRDALAGRALDCIVNTHLHSDHCGGNAALQQAWPAVRTLIPPGQAEAVHAWDEEALTYAPTGQECPRFRITGTLEPGGTVALGDRAWQVHAAPGHDPHSVILFEPQSAALISADALWENGFGVVFPELDGEDAFDTVGATLDLIERLAPRVVIPGHGSLFTDAPRALAAARQRLAGFIADPRKHALYAAKVLLKYKLLEWQQAPLAQVHAWLAATPLFGQLHRSHFATAAANEWAVQLVQALVDGGAARSEGGVLHNA